jgi:hypothetical protein
VSFVKFEQGIQGKFNSMEAYIKYFELIFLEM